MQDDKQIPRERDTERERESRKKREGMKIVTQASN